jgi:microcompartment protein CcmK/EutM
MILAQVIGNLVSTEKHPHYRGYKILVVQPIDPRGKPKGKSLLALDGVQAGVGDKVLIVDEGGSARVVLNDDPAMTVRTVICGIIDRIDEEWAPREYRGETNPREYRGENPSGTPRQ